MTSRLILLASIVLAPPALAAEDFVLSCSFGLRSMVLSVEEPAVSVFGYPRPTIRLSGARPGETMLALVEDYDATVIRVAFGAGSAAPTSTRETHTQVQIDRASGRATVVEVNAFVPGRNGGPGYQFSLDPVNGTCSRGSRL